MVAWSDVFECNISVETDCYLSGGCGFDIPIVSEAISMKINCQACGGLVSSFLLLTLSAHAREGYSSHFVCLSFCLSVCLSVADLEDGGLLARLQFPVINPQRACARGL